MRVFISWSGDRSKAIAEALHAWLPTVIQAVDPWMSAADIEKGARWSSDMAELLEKSHFGVVCLTPENLMAPWILFESGALSKTVGRGFVCPYLLGVEPTQLTGPLAQFQAAKSDQEGTHGLVRSINNALPEGRLPETVLATSFARGWRELDVKLESIPEAGGVKPPERSEREILEEVLEGVRQLQRRPGPVLTSVAHQGDDFLSRLGKLTPDEIERMASGPRVDLYTAPSGAVRVVGDQPSAST